MNIRKFENQDNEQVITLYLKLFKDYAEEEARKDFQKSVSSPKHQIFVSESNDGVIGFAMGSIRSDYVEGCTTSPVGYLEAIFVQENHRKGGIAKLLFQAVERWAKENQCTEMGSDTWTWNKGAQAFHERIGFEEDDILIHYIKKID
ncbi:MAG: aminoglycoside 6'-N-acetyltransferase [Bacteroidota bacterium]